MTEQDTAYGPIQGVRLIAGREISTRLRSKAFRIITLILAAAFVIMPLILKLASGGSGGVDATVGVTSQTAVLSGPLKQSGQTAGQTLAVQQFGSEADGRAQVTAGKVDALLIGDGQTVRVVVKKELNGKLRGVLDSLAGQMALDKQITALGGKPAQVSAQVASAKINVLPMEQPYPYDPVQLFIGAIAGVLIYLALMFTGQLVAQGVVEEKSSRVVELLLATVKPWQLMAGKVAGIGVIGLIQMVVAGVVGLIAGVATGQLPDFSAALSTVIWLIVWFILGFTIYSLVFAALGALVSKQEDVGGVVAPALMFVIAGYVVGISILPSDPGNRLVEILSVIPTFSPTLMPMRLAMGGVPIWETALSLVLSVALIPGLVWFSARIYRNAIVRTGTKVKFRDALRAA